MRPCASCRFFAGPESIRFEGRSIGDGQSGFCRKKSPFFFNLGTPNKPQWLIGAFPATDGKGCGEHEPNTDEAASGASSPSAHPKDSNRAESPPAPSPSTQS